MRVADAALTREDVLRKLEEVLAHGHGELTIIVHQRRIAEIVQSTRHRETARGMLRPVERSGQ